MQNQLKQPLSNVQLELLKTFSHQISDTDLVDLKKVLAKFFAEKLIQQADQVWEDKNITDEDVDLMLNTKMRKRK